MAYDIYKGGLISFNKLEVSLKIYGKSIEDFNLKKSDIDPIDIDFSGFGTGDDTDEED
jgi:hypothetical protein